MPLHDRKLKELWIQIAQGDLDYYQSASKPTGASVSRSIFYTQSTDPMQALEIIRPQDNSAVLPVIVHIHGGGWVYGHKDSYYKYYCMALAKQGYTVLNINYRLAFDHPFPACVRDIFTVFDWMTHNAKAQRLDLENVFLVGDSAGAHLAALSAQIQASEHLQKAYKVKPSAICIKALGLSCGVYDFERHVQDDPDPMTLRLFKTVFGKRDFRKHPLYELSSVSHNLKASFPPTYVLSSKSDVPLILESEAFIKELKAQHCIVKVRIMPKKLKLSHVFNIKLDHPESLEVMREMSSFFQSFTS